MGKKKKVVAPSGPPVDPFPQPQPQPCIERPAPKGDEGPINTEQERKTK